MRPLSKRHAAILDKLTAPVRDGGHCRFDHAPGTYLAAVVEKIGPRRYSIAHYFEQHGDLVPDPDLEFVRQDGEWFPAAATMAIGSYTRAVETDQDGKITGVRRRAYAGLRSFAGTLLTNIKAQQRPLVPTSTEGDE